MPSPVGHTLAGLGGFVLMCQYPVRYLDKFPLLLSAVVIANLPDIDMLPGLVLFGEPGRFHRQATHSLLVAVVIGAIVGIVAKRLRLSGILWGSWAAGLYALHICLDMLVADAIPPTGVQALWPAQQFFFFPVTVFSGFNYSAPDRTTLQTLFSLNNLVTILREIIIIAPFVWLIWYAKKRRERV